MKFKAILFFLLVSPFLMAQKAIIINLADAIKKPVKTFMLSEFADDIFFIPLETTPECLIGSHYSISYTQNGILASSTEEKNFFHFDTDGNFLNQIGSLGNGPEEYSVGLFYFFDSKNSLFYTHDWQETICYNYNGDFIRRIPTPNLNMGVAQLLGNDYIVYSNDTYFHGKDKPNQLYIVDKNGNPVHKFKGVIEENKKYGVSFISRDIMYPYNGEIYYKPNLENVVYKLSSSKKKAAVWKFETKDKKINVSRDERNYKDTQNTIYVFQLRETDKFLFILYGLNNEYFHGLYDKTTNEFNNYIIKDDLSGGMDFIPAGLCDEGYLTMVYPPAMMKEAKKYGKAKLTKRANEMNNIIESAKDDDNPIITMVRVKK